MSARYLPEETPYAQGEGFVIRRGSHTAIAASNLYVPGVGVTCVVGPNGAGKTSMLHALGGLIPVSEGAFEVLGGAPGVAQRRVSYVLQNATLPKGFPLTVKEAVGMGLFPNLGLLSRPTKAHRQRVNEAMERLDVQNLAHRHLTELSGGQRQRVYVAQGLVQEHEVLLLDEPMTGLDLVSAQTIEQVIKEEAASGVTVMMTTHDLRQAQKADWAILLSGRVVSYGPPSISLSSHLLCEAYGLDVIEDGVTHASVGAPNAPESAVTLSAPRPTPAPVTPQPMPTAQEPVIGAPGTSRVPVTPPANVAPLRVDSVEPPTPPAPTHTPHWVDAWDDQPVTKPGLLGHSSQWVQHDDQAHDAYETGKHRAISLGGDRRNPPEPSADRRQASFNPPGGYERRAPDPHRFDGPQY